MLPDEVFTDLYYYIGVRFKHVSMYIPSPPTAWRLPLGGGLGDNIDSGCRSSAANESDRPESLKATRVAEIILREYANDCDRCESHHHDGNSEFAYGASADKGRELEFA